MDKFIKETMGGMAINVCHTLIGDIHLRTSSFQRICCSILGKLGVSYYPIDSIDSYQEKYGIINRILLKGRRYGISSVSSDMRKKECLESEKVPLPAIYLSEFKDLCFTGNSDVLVDVNNHCVINDYCYNLDDSIFFVDGLLYRQKNNHCLLRNNFQSTPQLIESGIMASGKFSKNYYHTLYENFCRLSLLKQCNIAPGVPVLVDEVALKIPSMTEMIKCLIGTNRQIIPLKKDALYQCKHLYYIDHLHQITPHLLKSSTTIKSKTCFDVPLLLAYRDNFLRYKSNKSTPKRIFLTRENTSSRNFNEEDVFKMLEKYGFEKVDCAKYSLYDQISLFNNAEFIVGGSGAAFSNLLFAKPGGNVICFRSIQGVGTPVFKSIADIVGCHFYQYCSDRNSNNKDIHAGYYIDPTNFEDEINKLLH